MKVSELIELLRSQPQDSDVYFGIMVGDEESEAARDELQRSEAIVAQFSGAGIPLAVSEDDSPTNWIQLNAWY